MDENFESTLANIKIWWREADESEKRADLQRWRVAEELFNLNVIHGVPQEELADALERSQPHISLYIKVWRVYGVENDDSLTFNECYQKSKRGGLPKARAQEGPDGKLDREPHYPEESDYYLGNSDHTTLVDLLRAIETGIAADVMAEKVADEGKENWEASQEDAEAIYDWLNDYWTALEEKSASLAP